MQQQQPWTKIALTEEQLQIIYREWGVFYTHKQKLDIAAKYYDISLQLKEDPKAWYYRSRCKRNIAQTEQALNDARAAMASDPKSQPYTVEVCDGIYQLNQLENARCESFNNSLKFRGIKLKSFHNLNNVLEENFYATLGYTLGPFILKNEKYLYLAWRKVNEEANVDERPLWKILREQEKCDVVSVIEEEEELLSPREIARRKRAFNVFNQIYMRKSWMDVLFLRALKKNRSLLLHQSEWTTPLLAELTERKYDATMKFLKMLHARCPLYTQKVRNCPNKKLAEKVARDYVFRVQYQIHRNMLAILHKIRYLRATKQIEALSKFVEEVMGDYVVLKTRRTMPWKFEFLNEVYNLLALAHIDLYVDIPKNLRKIKPQDRLQALLQMPREKDNQPVAFVFGDRSSHTDENAGDLNVVRHKKLVDRMERRLISAKYPIERAYLLHEISRSNLKCYRFDECCVVARKSMEEAKKSKSLIWRMLGWILICKSHAYLRKIEQITALISEGLDLATKINNDKLQHFIELIESINESNFQEKKRLRSRTSSASRASSGSRASNQTVLVSD